MQWNEEFCIIVPYDQNDNCEVAQLRIEEYFSEAPEEKVIGEETTLRAFAPLANLEEENLREDGQEEGEVVDEDVDERGGIEEVQRAQIL